jgi:hypothetical protein
MDTKNRRGDKIEGMREKKEGENGEKGHTIERRGEERK